MAGLKWGKKTATTYLKSAALSHKDAEVGEQGAPAEEEPQAVLGPAGGPAQVPRARRLAASARGLASRHRIFVVVLLLAIVPRVVAMLGYGPAVLFRMDSFDYLWGANHPSPNVINPSGYSLFLWLLRPFHSLVLVAALQHVLGLAIGVMVYAVMRRSGLPAWGAALAAVPVLFDPAQILIEQMAMADLLGMALMMVSFALLLGTSPRLWRLALAGLLMGVSAIVRPSTLLIVALIPVYLLVRRVGWRPAAAALLAGIVPVTAYMGWFDSVHGSFNLTNSNGLFLWTRTMSFAECGVINPPADLQPLCPQAQPGRLSEPVPSKRPLPKYYLWNRLAWQWQPPSSPLVPDAAAFTQAKNSRALRFAVDAITAQPFAYVRVVAAESLQPFVQTNNLRFPVSKRADSAPLARGDLAYATTAVTQYSRDAVTVPQILHHRYATELHQPYVSLMAGYQSVVHLPGPLLGLILLVGLAGIVIPRRRTAAGALLWVSAVVLMLLSTAEHEYTYRYVIAAVPLLCMAAGIALARPTPREPASEVET